MAQRAHPWSPAQPLAAASPQSFVVASAASVSEILKQKGTVRVTRIHTGTVMHVDEQDPDARSQKSTIEIDLRKACLRNRSETDGR